MRIRGSWGALVLALAGCDGGLPNPADVAPAPESMAVASLASREHAQSLLLGLRREADEVSTVVGELVSSETTSAPFVVIELDERLRSIRKRLDDVPRPAGDPRSRAMREQLTAILGRCSLARERWPLPKGGASGFTLDQILDHAQRCRRDVVRLGPACTAPQVEVLAYRVRGLERASGAFKPTTRDERKGRSRLIWLVSQIDESVRMIQAMLLQRRQAAAGTPR